MLSIFREEFHEDSSDEFGTPVTFHQPIAEAVGGFDLDPASGAEDQPLASTRYTEADDGLAQEWFGKVWLNPPYSEKVRWIRKALNEVNAGHVDLAVLLLPVDTSTQWFHEYVAQADALCFVEGRLSFVGGDRNPNFGVLLAAFGDVPDDLLDVLDRRGTVYERSARHQRHEQAKIVPTERGAEESDKQDTGVERSEDADR